MYSATKAYNGVLSAAIREAYGEFVDVLTVRPFSVKSTMNGGYFPVTITADAHAKSVIDQLSHETETYGHWKHDFQIRFLMVYTPYIYYQNYRKA